MNACQFDSWQLSRGASQVFSLVHLHKFCSCRDRFDCWLVNLSSELGKATKRGFVATIALNLKTDPNLVLSGGPYTNQCGPFKMTRRPPLSQVKLHDSPICTPPVILDRKKCPPPLGIPETKYISWNWKKCQDLYLVKSDKKFGFCCCAKTLKIPVFASNYLAKEIW